LVLNMPISRGSGSVLGSNPNFLRRFSFFPQPQHVMRANSGWKSGGSSGIPSPGLNSI
jgi:hypothetical protein